MKSIVGAFGTLLVLVLHIFLCIAVCTVSGQVAEAKEYKADVIAEIENSNFNPNVINGCIAQARTNGYELQVTNYVYDVNHDIQTAEVVLKYAYTIPLLGIADTKTTRGIAR